MMGDSSHRIDAGAYVRHRSARTIGIDVMMPATEDRRAKHFHVDLSLNQEGQLERSAEQWVNEGLASDEVPFLFS